MTQPLQTAVIRAEPDAYDITRPKLMGRHAAGHGYLRAAVAARGEGPIYGYSAHDRSRRGFAQIVRQIDPAATTVLFAGDQLERLADPGVIYLGDSNLPLFAGPRLRAGITAYSLCGVTHTTASTTAMDTIRNLVTAPVAPWDALVCTSTAVLETVRRIHEAEADYLRWRLGEGVRIEGPQLPVIPLGVHCDDFQFTADQRAAGRAALGIDADEVAALYVGRFLFHGKAHPAAMYRALQAAAERTGRRVVLVMCGWAPTEAIQEAFVKGASDFAPGVRTLFVDGREPQGREHAWSCADLFFSLSDNIQETFGLTPIEAKAAGLPVVVTDWDGYRDTVRHGVDGFRVPTWAPSAGMGAPIARALDTGVMTYDAYCWGAAASTAIESGELFDGVTRLVADPDLRRKMGEAGRAHAREVYDWPVVYRAYQALWGELTLRRKAAVDDPRWRAAPRCDPARLDPFHAFGHYPTHSITLDTRMSLASDAAAEALRANLDHALFTATAAPRNVTEALFAAISAGDATVADAARAIGVAAPSAGRSAGLLAKMGLVRLS